MQNEANRTAIGEIVFKRHNLDFKQLSKTSKRDTVLEENLVDVRRLLKTSAFSGLAASSNN